MPCARSARASARAPARAPPGAHLPVPALGGGQLGQHALLHVLALLHHHLENGQRVCAHWLLLAVVFFLQSFKVSL